MDKIFDFTNKHRKIIGNEKDSQFEDNRDVNQDEKAKYELSKLTIHDKIQKLDLDNVMMEFDDSSLYPGAMYDENSVYSKKESGFTFKQYMIKV